MIRDSRFLQNEQFRTGMIWFDYFQQSAYINTSYHIEYFIKANQNTLILACL